MMYFVEGTVVQLIHFVKPIHNLLSIVIFSCVRCSDIVMLPTNAINENIPNTTSLEVVVPKVTWALRFFDSSIPRCSHRDRRRPFS